MNETLRVMLAQAHEKLRAAKLLLQEGFYSDAASRAYYAAFHAISAVLLSRGISCSSHARLIGVFNKEFVHTGKFPQDFTTLLTRLFEDRQSGDYDSTVELTECESREDVDDARRIVDVVEHFLENEAI